MTDLTRRGFVTGAAGLAAGTAVAVAGTGKLAFASKYSCGGSDSASAEESAAADSLACPGSDASAETDTATTGTTVEEGESTMSKVYWVLNDKLGEGEEELGTLLMQKFIYNLARASVAPTKMIFMNNGVYLTTEGSEVLDDLKLLVEKGTAISTCGTCLEYHNLTDKLAVGVAGQMDGAVETTLTADDVVLLR